MAHFPMFVSLEGKNVLIVGGGKVAYRKLEKLLPFKPNIYVVAKEIKEESFYKACKQNNIKIEERKFLFTDLDGKDLVIVAVDNIDLQREIYNFCYRRKIPVNCVDSPDYCTFLFPAYVKKEDIVIGISTSGKIPILAKKLKEIIEKALPENIDDIFNYLYKLRKSLKKGKEREEVLRREIEKLL